MARRSTHSASLERTLSAAEKLIIDGKADDFGGRGEVDAGAGEVARLIARHLPSAEKTKKASRKVTGESLEARIAYLRRLLSSRTQFSPQLRAVFGSRKQLNTEETEAAIAELVRLGSRKQKESNDSD